MKLDDAINHCLEKANEFRSCNIKCSCDHMQLANWLIELKEFREKGYDRFCREMENNYKTFVASALQGRLASGQFKEFDDKFNAKRAIDCAKEVIKLLKDEENPFKDK